MPGLDEVARRRVERAAEVAADAAWNVVRLEASQVCLLEYEDFDRVDFPRLLASTLLDPEAGRRTTRSFRHVGNPLILHRKELLVGPDHPGRPAWVALTSRLEALGLFADPIRIGRERRWAEMMRAAGLPWDR